MTKYAKELRDSLYVYKLGPKLPFALVDGALNPSPPFLHRTNDRRRLGVAANVGVDKYGTACALKNIKPADIVNAKTIADLANSELFMDYGKEFWKIQQTLGRTPDNPIVFE